MDNSIFKTPKILLTRLPTPVPAGEAEVGGCKPNDGDVVQEISGEKPMEGVARSSVATEVDSDSSGSVSSVRSRRLWRRHSRSIDSCSLNFTSDTDEPAPKTQATDGRGRGRPPSVGKYVGLRQAQRERDRLKREEIRTKTSPSQKEDLEKCGHIVRAIVRKSGNLKGTSQKALNWVTSKITRYITQPESEVVARLEDEVKKSREHSARLESSMKLIQEENAALRRRLEELEASASKTSAEDMWAMVEARVQARLESALMGPAQRPALAHETRASTGDTQLPVSGGIVGGPPQPKTKREKGKGKGKKTVPASPIPTPVAGPSSAPPQAVAGPSAAKATEAESRTKKSRDNGKKEATAPGKEDSAQPQTPSKGQGEKAAPTSATCTGAPPSTAGPRIDGDALPSPVSSGEAVVEGCKPNDDDVPKEITGAMPMEVAAEFARPLSLDTDSSESGSTVRSKKLWRRKSQTRSSFSQLSLTSDTDEPAPKTQAIDGRMRGRPPSVGKYVGLKKAQLERDRLQREAARKDAEKELEDQLQFIKSPVPPRISDTEEDRPVLKEDLRKCTQVVRNVVRKSGNLKGTSQKALNWVTDKIVKYVEQPESAVIARLEEEIKKWQEHSARLEANMKAMKEENATLKRRLEDLEASANKSSTEEMLAMVEARVQARLESALMGPAQRRGAEPKNRPKGKGKRKEKGAAQPAPAPAPLPAPVAGPSSAPPQPVAGPSTAPATTTASTAKKTQDRRRETPKQKPQKGKKNGPPPAQPAPEPRVLPPAPANVDTPWVEVVRRKKKGKPAAAPTNSTQPPKPTRRKEPKLRPPRSAAVVISLTPAAIAKGLTYKSVLTDAQNKVDLTGLEISKMRPKFAATGAPMYEVPGANSEERADSLAARLRECFAGSEDIKISRPTKTVELRLSELDYTATPETVAAALAKA
ncbi:serine/arginine repetitive matrix protein 1-like, partial [Manduca sexta]|uniref:serine/arginine repetitive matrix protein 1-like n=1 Tax=Manduca sexta TaxID=7130 RepID=UPI00188DEEB3